MNGIRMFFAAALIGLIVFGTVDSVANRKADKAKIKIEKMNCYKSGWYHGLVHANSDSAIIDYCFKMDSTRVDSHFKLK